MILRSKYLICTPTDTIENGAVAINNDGTIEAAGPFGEVKRAHSGKIIDRHDEILCPGFINAHAHLGLTALKDTITDKPPFFDWLHQVATHLETWSDDDYFDSAMAGVSLNLAGGATTVVEICNNTETANALQLSGIRKYLLFEVIGFDPNLLEICKGRLEKRRAVFREEALLHTGVAPHAPYSVGQDLLVFCRDKAMERDQVLSIHLAESPEEAEFVQKGTGAIKTFKQKVGFPADDWSGANVSPVQYVSDLGLLGRHTLLVHCNYLSDEDIARMADSEATAVYCPRSHQYFDHPVHPLPRLLDAGVPVALGTDSLASNEGLSMLDEMKFVRSRFPELEDETILALGTTTGARALGAAGQIGILRKGAYADVISVRPGDGQGAVSRLLGDGSEVTMNMTGGRILFDSHAGEKNRTVT